MAINWDVISSRVDRPASVVEAYSQFVGPPIFCNSEGSDRGYRFLAPGALHYCILKSAKAIVVYKSATAVAGAGYHTEVATLIRVLVECCNLVEWVANSGNPGASEEYKSAVETHISDFFSDNLRSADELPKVNRGKQKRVHDQHGELLDRTLRDMGEKVSEKPASELMSSVYIRFSKYVHAAYPETMDLYGKSFGKLDLGGSSGSVKDLESAEMLGSFAETVGNAVAAMVVFLGRAHLNKLSAEDQSWFREKVSRN